MASELILNFSRIGTRSKWDIINLVSQFCSSVTNHKKDSVTLTSKHLDVPISVKSGWAVIRHDGTPIKSVAIEKPR